MRSFFRNTVCGLIAMIALSANAIAQESDHVNFSAGVGFSVPVQTTGYNFNTGWNIDFRGGLSLKQYLAADLDFTYLNSSLNAATLAQLGEPNGGVGLWSLTFNPVLQLAPKESRLRPYVTAGYGLYHMNLTVSQPALTRTLYCDPFFGVCYPAVVGVNQVVGSESTYKGGFNVGAGFEIPFGRFHNASVFMEARYHRMFMTEGADITYVPVTFGFRW